MSQLTTDQVAELAGVVTYVPPNVDHADCCRGDDVRHESVSDLPNLFADGHACVDCCPCDDCGEHRAAQYAEDPSGWPDGPIEGWRTT